MTGYSALALANSELLEKKLIPCVTPCINRFHSLPFLLQSMKAAVVSESGDLVLHYAVASVRVCVRRINSVFAGVCICVELCRNIQAESISLCVSLHDIVIHSLLLWTDTATHTKTYCISLAFIYVKKILDL